MAGAGCRSKWLSHDVLTADEEFQRGLLAGLFRGDGCSTTGGMMLDLVNPELVDQVQQILRRLGIVSIVRQYVNRAGNVTGQVFVPGLPGTNEEFIFDVGKNGFEYAFAQLVIAISLLLTGPGSYSLAGMLPPPLRKL